MKKQAVLYKLAQARLAINYVLRHRLVKQAASISGFMGGLANQLAPDTVRTKAENIIGDLVPDQEGVSDPEFISQAMFGDTTATPIIQSFYDTNNLNRTNIQQATGLLQLLRRYPAARQQFIRTFMALPKEQRAQHPFNQILNNVWNNTSVQKIISQEDIADMQQRQQGLLTLDSSDPRFSKILDEFPDYAYRQLSKNQLLAPHIKYYSDAVKTPLNQYKPNPQWGTPSTTATQQNTAQAPNVKSIPTSGSNVKSVLKKNLPNLNKITNINISGLDTAANNAEIAVLNSAATLSASHPATKVYNYIQKKHPLLPSFNLMRNSWIDTMKDRIGRYPFKTKYTPGVYYSERGIIQPQGYETLLKGTKLNDLARHGFITVVHDKKPKGVPAVRLSNGQYVTTVGMVGPMSGWPNGVYIGVNGNAGKIVNPNEINSLNSSVNPVLHGKTDWSLTMHPITTDPTEAGRMTAQLLNLAKWNRGRSLGQYGFSKDKANCLATAAFLMSNIANEDSYPNNIGRIGVIPKHKINDYKNKGLIFNPKEVTKIIQYPEATQTSIPDRQPRLQSSSEDYSRASGNYPLDATAPSKLFLDREGGNFR